MSLSTYDKRKAEIFKIAEETIATFPEKLKIIYNWVMFERALINRDRAQKRAETYAKRLEKDIDVLNFRHELQDL